MPLSKRAQTLLIVGCVLLLIALPFIFPRTAKRTISGTYMGKMVAYVGYHLQVPPLIENEAYEEALASLETIIEFYPQFFEARLQRGYVLGALDRCRASINEFSKLQENLSAEHEFYRMGTHINRGMCYHELGIYDSALLDYNAALVIYPEDGRTYNNRANTYRHMGILEQAKQDVAKSLELNEENGWVYATLAMIYADEGKHQLFYPTLEKAIDPTFIYPYRYPLSRRLSKEKTLQHYQDSAQFQRLLKMYEGK